MRPRVRLLSMPAQQGKFDVGVHPGHVLQLRHAASVWKYLQGPLRGWLGLVMLPRRNHSKLPCPLGHPSQHAQDCRVDYRVESTIECQQRAAEAEISCVSAKRFQETSPLLLSGTPPLPRSIAISSGAMARGRSFT